MNDTDEDGTMPGPNESDSRLKRLDIQNMPTEVGRYKIRRRLGRGGFGEVYVGFDEQLQREVAIKLTLGDRIGDGSIKMFLDEARMLAELDHPNIVPVFDIGTTERNNLYIVSKLIDGCDLATRIETDRPSRELSLCIIAAIADALHYAHSKGVIHRDIKPANILLDKQDRPYLADFGIALRETDQVAIGEITGTPAYMSPEQARGEGHLISNQSDIYSLGVVLYELLCGRRPFRGKTPRDLLKQVRVADVRTPRMFDPTISRQLENVCLKAVARRPSDRYAIARDLAEEVRWLLVNPSGSGKPSSNLRTPNGAYLPSSHADDGSGPAGVEPLRSDPLETDLFHTPTQIPTSGLLNSHPKSGPVKVIPKGLLSFDAEDAHFFLELLPGPYDRDGVPESLNFWKKRIESTDIEHSFRVGLVYGPSGCGKSSLIKAGLLPRLPPKIQTIYVEATPDDTAGRLLKGIEQQIPEIRVKNLADTLAWIRRKRLVPSGGKLLLVIDQFEQWLYATSDYADTELTDALRQCDGVTIQAIVMVREDFWISVSRFLKELDIPILERENSAMVDLFDKDHAKKVYASFGRAFGKLPDDPNAWTDEQRAFIEQSIEGVSEKEKVISVRLALLAEMMKGKTWTPRTFAAIGGVSGVGVTFLEEMFGDRHAPIQYRQHQEAIRGFLGALLPPIGTDIKGTKQDSQSLQSTCGYVGKPQEFSELLKILNSDLRLITPVDEGGVRLSYQLTHDYLVPSIREWLTCKQRETNKGRAELKLAERAAAWSLYKESKQLPTMLEWVQINRLTEAAIWKSNERELMQQATRHHVQRISLAVAAIALLAVGSWFGLREVVRQQEATRVEGLINALTNAEPTQVPEIIKQLDANSAAAVVGLGRLLALDAATPANRRARLHARMANVSRDSSLIEPLKDEILSGKLEYLLPIRQILRPSAAKLTGSFQSILHDSRAASNRRFRAALALADYVSYSDEELWTDSNRAFVARQLVLSNSDLQPLLRETLRPIQGILLNDLERIFSDNKASDIQRLNAANALADYAAKDRSRLTDLLTVANLEQHDLLYPLVSAMLSPEIITQLGATVRALPPDDLGSLPRVAHGQRRANAAVCMLRLGERERVFELFDWTDDPEAVTQFIVRCKPRGISVDTLLDLLDLISKKIKEPFSFGSMTNPRARNYARYALLLAIGEYEPSEIPLARREALVKQLTEWYLSDPSSAVHGASGWLLRHLGEREIADRIDRTPVPYDPDREWYTLAIQVQPVSNQTILDMLTPKSPKTLYFTFIVCPEGEYTIGSRNDEMGRESDEVLHTVILTRPVAVLDREISFEEFIAFSPSDEKELLEWNFSPSGAVGGIDWYKAVRFCRWLGQELGLQELDQCYADPKSLSTKFYPRDPIVKDSPWNWPVDLSKRGFRLLTESEWEVVARNGARTAFGFGNDEALLNRFDWFGENSGKRIHPSRELRPTARGLFDLHGNLSEWTHDCDGSFGRSGKTDPVGAKNTTSRVCRGGGLIDDPSTCRLSCRYGRSPDSRLNNLGFRIAITPSAGEQK